MLALRWIDVFNFFQDPCFLHLFFLFKSYINLQDMPEQSGTESCWSGEFSNQSFYAEAFPCCIAVEILVVAWHLKEVVNFRVKELTSLFTSWEHT